MIERDEKTNKKMKKEEEKLEFQRQFPFLKNLDPKMQRKEIQKIKNRISAQNHRDKQKSEIISLREENKRLKMNVDYLNEKNKKLSQIIQNLKCDKCGFKNDIHIEEDLPNEKRLAGFKRIPSNSCIFKLITIISVIFLFSMNDQINLSGKDKTNPKIYPFDDSRNEKNIERNKNSLGTLENENDPIGKESIIENTYDQAQKKEKYNVNSDIYKSIDNECQKASKKIVNSNSTYSSSNHVSARKLALQKLIVWFEVLFLVFFVHS